MANVVESTDDVIVVVSAAGSPTPVFSGIGRVLVSEEKIGSRSAMSGYGDVAREANLVLSLIHI